MNSITKLICTTVVFVAVGCSTAVASEPSLTTQPYNPNASTLPTNVPDGDTEAATSLDISRLEKAMEENAAKPDVAPREIARTSAKAKNRGSKKKHKHRGHRHEKKRN